MKMTNLASSSGGNCTYLEAGGKRVLIDLGINCKQAVTRLDSIDVDPASVDAVFLTHEHSDHVNGLKVFCKKYHTPVYGTALTLEAVLAGGRMEPLPEDLFCPIRADEPFHFGDLTIRPFGISHDAADPVGYRFEAEGRAAAVATDLGTYTDYTVRNLQGAELLLLESNHDLFLLETGSYTTRLKRRVMSCFGHLSNEQCAALITRLLSDGNRFSGILLGHLSQENNREALAYDTVCDYITQSQVPYNGRELPIFVAHRDAISETIFC
ncbi:MAG: MBL fold metallo-hydrolase [Lachnospiraceae bacterium]|nr:MBL fold metallo-hydrolase [Lachnospiraceae bacterium]